MLLSHHHSSRQLKVVACHMVEWTRHAAAIAGPQLRLQRHQRLRLQELCLSANSTEKRHQEEESGQEEAKKDETTADDNELVTQLLNSNRNKKLSLMELLQQLSTKEGKTDHPMSSTTEKERITVVETVLDVLSRQAAMLVELWRVLSSLSNQSYASLL